MTKNILEKVLSSLSDKNIKFNDLRKLVLSLSFGERIKGSHYIFFKEGVAEIINLQPLKDGKARTYQVRQVRSIILKCELHEEIKDV